jgi:tripartite-type tricarboxylate transporter receptor subunit TctC
MNPSLNRRTVLACGAGTLLAPFNIARAQAFPSRPITMIVPWPPGGSTDRHLRTLAEIAGKHLGQNVLVRADSPHKTFQ